MAPLKPIQSFYLRWLLGGAAAAFALTSISLKAQEIRASISLEDGEITQPLGGPEERRNTKPEAVFINGFDTDADTAIRYARATGDKLGRGVRLIYHDLTMPAVDHANMVLSKIVGSKTFNAASDRLEAEIKAEIEAGRDIYLVGYSAGSIVINDAIWDVAEDYLDDLPADESAKLLSHIHVLTVAGACLSDENPFADGWPEQLGSVHHLFHKNDKIAQWFGEGDFDDKTKDSVHDYVGVYVRHVTMDTLTKSGRTIVRDE